MSCQDIMFGRPTLDEIAFIGYFPEGFLYGLYTGIFVMYFQNHATSNKESKETRNDIFYSICVLYVLSTALFAFDISEDLNFLLGRPLIYIVPIQSILFGCCDFIAQFILIYRCWIVWGRNIRVVIIPSVLTFAFLATWLAAKSAQYISESDQGSGREWANPMLISSLGLSLTVNALATGLIVFKILKVFREVKASSGDRILGATAGGSKLQHIIFILIESGMTLFSIQLVRLMATIVVTDTAVRALEIVITIHEMLTGITPTIILVRISMGLSFHDERSMEEFAIESLRFASNDRNPVPETGSSIGIGSGQDSRNDDDIGIQQNNDIEVVER